MYGEARSVRTTHAKIFQGTDEGLGLWGDSLPLCDTETSLLQRQQGSEIIRDLALRTFQTAGSSHT